MSDPSTLYDDLREEMANVLIGNERVVERLTVSLLTRGHVLMEGVPGVAKTTIANLFAQATGLSYNRVQMTPDVLPADITGTHIYREQTGDFELQRGPVFANVLLADEINRATPKTQSALLEAMQEERVTIDGQTLSLPDPFIVVATQNPIELEGTFELPEAQRDRFQFKLDVDLPARDDEREILDRFDANPELGPAGVEQVTDTAAIRAARETVSEVYVDPTVKEYVLDLVGATRESPDVEYGGSPRASLAFLNAAKAQAAIRGREYVVPDDVKGLAKPVLVHRLVLSTDAELSDLSPQEVVDDAVETVAPPSTGGVEGAESKSEGTAVGDGGDERTDPPPETGE